MAATKAQVHAAFVAISKKAAEKVAALPFFEQGMARSAMSPALIEEFAEAAANAVAEAPAS